MSEPLPFCKIKLQYLLEMVTDHALDDNALRVALYLALAHADHGTGESRHQVRVYNYNGFVHYIVDASAVILTD